MDHWMLKFLSEFAEPIGVKEDDGAVMGLYSVENIGVSPQDWSETIPPLFISVIV